MPRLAHNGGNGRKTAIKRATHVRSNIRPADATAYDAPTWPGKYR